jgi:hypothetical protein
MEKVAKEVKSVSNTLGEDNAQENITKRKFRVQFDIDYTGHTPPDQDPNSQTMPDMHMTVTQLLENHSRGIDGKVEVRQPLYFETEIPSLRDITDVEEYKEGLQMRLDKINEYIAHEKAQIDAERARKAEKEQSKQPDNQDPQE